MPVRNRAPLANRPEFVLHAAIGRRWLEPHFKTREAMLEVYEKIRPAYDRMKDEDLIPTLAILLPALKHSEAD